MALKKQTISIPFRFGLGRNTDAAAEGVPGLLELTNGVYNLEGAISRRHGFRRVVDAGVDATALVHAGGKLGVVHDEGVKSYDPERSYSQVADISSATTSTRVFDRVDRGGNVLATDIHICEVGGVQYLGVVSVERNDNNFRMRGYERYYNYDTGELLYDGQWVGTGGGDRVRAMRIVRNQDETKFFVVMAYVNGTTENIIGRTYDPTTNTHGSTLTITTAAKFLNGSGASDGDEDAAFPNICAMPSVAVASYLASGVYVAWVDSSNKPRVSRCSDTAVSGTTYTGTDDVDADNAADVAAPMAIYGINGGTFGIILLAYPINTGPGNEVVVDAIDPNTMTVAESGTAVPPEAFTSNAGGPLVFVEQDSDTVSLLMDNGQGRIRRATVDIAPGGSVDITITQDVDDFFGMRILSRGLTGQHAVLASNDSEYADVFVLDLDNVPRAPRRIVFENDGFTLRDTVPTTLVYDSDGNYLTYLPDALDSVGAVQAETFRHLGVIRVSGLQDGPLVTTHIQNAAYLGGSEPRAFTGTEVVEAAIMGAPPTFRASLAAGTALTDGEAYSYLAVATLTDELGRLYVSAPSAPVSRSPSGANRNTDLTEMSYAPVPTTNSRRRLQIYRTTGNGSVYYLLHSANLNSELSIADLEDAIVDTDLDVRDALYSTDALESEPPPPAAAMWTHRNRLMVVREDDREQVRYTQECVLPNAPRWHTVLQKNVSNAGGPIIAGASLGGGCALFQAAQIVAFAGEGPDGTGAEDTFTIPELVVQGVGARDAIGVVQVPEGVIFRAATGFHLLSGGGAPVFIGGAVRTLERTMGDTTAAAYLPALNQSWFAGSAGTLLVYDHLHARWYNFTFPGQAATTGYAAGIVELGGQVYMVRRDGEVFHYDNATYLDNDGSADVTFDLVVGLPLFRPAGFAGDFRVWKVFLETAFDATLNDSVSVRTYTYQPHRQVGKGSETADGTHTFTAAQLSTLPAGLGELRFRPRAQRAAAFRTVITVSHGAGHADADAGLRLLGIKYEYGVRAETSGSPTTPGQVS